MKGRDRNSPCWCGSGQKYKRCHSNRADQARENPWAAVDTNRRAFTKKKCYAYNVGLGICDGGIIKAHTVSRGPNLTKIAKNGHVLHYTATIQNLNKNGGRISATKIGINEASVFHGFCRRHDRILFSCIENEPFVGRPDQCLAVAYRTISRELYGKDASAHFRETLRGADKGKEPHEQELHQKMLDYINIGNEAAIRETKATHDFLTTALVKNQPNVIKSLIFEFNAHLPFMFSGAWSPFTDLYNNQLQVGYEDEYLEQVFFSSFFGEKHPMVCISWRDIESAPGKVIAEQLKELPADQLASACLQIVTKHIENIFFNPDWFENLSEKQRNHLGILVTDGIDKFGSVPSSLIALEIDFKLPAATRFFET